MPGKLRFGKFVKKKSEKDNQYVWTLKQFGKTTGAQSRELKAALDSLVQNWLSPES